MGATGEVCEIGIIPRLCHELLEAIVQGSNDPSSESEILNSGEQRIQSGNKNSIKMVVSFYEIYNEKAYDLLGTNPGSASRVRECPRQGFTP